MNQELSNDQSHLTIWFPEEFASLCQEGDEDSDDDEDDEEDEDDDAEGQWTKGCRAQREFGCELVACEDGSTLTNQGIDQQSIMVDLVDNRG